MKPKALTAQPLVAQARADTPLGPITLAATADGLAGLWFDDQKHHPGPLAAPVDAGQRWIALALRELAAYWRIDERGDGRSEAVHFSVPIDAPGTTFQRSVWQALQGIAPGRTLSYGALAQGLGRASAVRAVGAAVGRNPVSVIVPCHRVMGSDGALTGYAGGVERKAALLRLEGALI